MSDRFFSSIPVDGPTIELTGDQAHHAANVMRLGVGDVVGVFDVTGREFRSTIREISKKRVLLSVDEEIAQRADNLPAVVIAIAMPKGDRQKFLIEKLVELGASTVIPLATRRSVAVVKENVIKRMEKQVIEACKQCGRNRPMQIRNPHSVRDLVTKAPFDEAAILLLAEPRCETTLADRIKDAASRFTAVVAVGPEGGFTSEEVDELHSAGYRPFRMGDSILRIETAAIAATALIRLR